MGKYQSLVDMVNSSPSPTPSAVPSVTATPGKYADLVNMVNSQSSPPAPSGVPSPPSPSESTTPYTDSAMGSFNAYLNEKFPSPPWLKKIEEPVRSFLGEPGLPSYEATRGLLSRFGVPKGEPEFIKPMIGAYEEARHLLTPANAAITAGMVAQPELIPYLAPAMIAPIASRLPSKLARIARGEATKEEAGGTAADVLMLLAPGVAKYATPRVPYPIPKPNIQELTPTQWMGRYREVPGPPIPGYGTEFAQPGEQGFVGVPGPAPAPPTEEAVGEPIPQGGETNASGITSTTSVPEHEVRARVGEETPLRQQGETAVPRTEGEQPQPTGQPVAAKAPEPNVNAGQGLPNVAPDQMTVQQLTDAIANERAAGRAPSILLTSELQKRQLEAPKPAPREPVNKEALKNLFTPDEQSEYRGLVSKWAQLDLEGGRLINDPKNPRAWQIAEEQRAIKDRLHELESKLPDGDVYDIIGIGSGATNIGTALHAGADHLNMLVLEHSGGRGTASSRTPRYANVAGAPSPMGQSGPQRELIDRMAAQRMGSQFKTVPAIESIEFDNANKVWNVKTKGPGPQGEGGQTFRSRVLSIGTGTRPRNAPFKLYDAEGKEVTNTQITPGKRVHLDDARGMAYEAKGGDTAVLGGANSAGQGAVDVADTPGSGIVHIFYRGPELSMSGYLQDQVMQLVDEGKIVLHPNSGIDPQRGVDAPSPENGMNYVVHSKTGDVPVKAVGSFIGGVPNTDVLPSYLLKDPKGFIRTTEDLRPLMDVPGQGEIPVPQMFVGGSVRSAQGINRMGPSEGEGMRISALANSEIGKLEDQGLLPSWKRELPRNRQETGQTTKTAESSLTSTQRGKPGEQMQSPSTETEPLLPSRSTGSSKNKFWKPAKEVGQRQAYPPPGGKVGKPKRPPPPPPNIKTAAELMEHAGGVTQQQQQEQQQRLRFPGMLTSEANARVRENPRRPDMVITGLANGDLSSIDSVDATILVQHRAKLQEARDRLGERAMDQNLSTGDRAEAATAFEDLDSQIRMMDEATHDGDILQPLERKAWHNFRQRDYSFESMEQKLVVAKAGTPLTDAEKKTLKEQTEKLSNAMAQVEAKKVRMGFAPGKPADQQLRDLQYEVYKAKQELDRAVFRETFKHLKLLDKSWKVTEQVMAIPRTIMASVDLSAVRRQGGLVFYSHPIESIKAIPDMIKAARSEKDYFTLMQDIRERPNAELYVSSKLGLTDIKTPKMSNMEEMYMSEWADKIPLISHSQRAYVYYLNRIRADTFDSMAKTLTSKGVPTAKQAEIISNFVNVFTGRGHLPDRYVQAATLLNDLFFAPRYVLSRFQALTLQPMRYSMQDPAVAKVIAGEYARTLVGMGVVYGTVAALGKDIATVEYDPRSTDWGKIKIGNTRIDIMAGLSQATVLLSRLATGQVKTSQGQIESIRGPNLPYTRRGAIGITLDFLRSKLGPLPSMVLNTVQGQKVTGEPTSFGKELLDMITPMTTSDIYKSIQEHGVPEGMALGLMAIFGDGVQTYAQRAKPTRQIKRHRTRAKP